jgi:hypothetical protein
VYVLISYLVPTPLSVQIVEFSPFIDGESVDLDLLKSTIRVEHLGLYMRAAIDDKMIVPS